MKKIISFLLASMLVLGLCACSGGESAANQQTQQTSQVSEFKVGYGRMDITPSELGAPMSGYGQSHKRLHTKVLDPLYVSAVVITGTNGETIALLSVDLTTCQNGDDIRKKIEEGTGIPFDNIMISTTHTHSAWDQGLDANARTLSLYHKNAVEAVKMALEDQAPATISIGRTETENLNFVRHYVMNDGTFGGDNFGDYSSGIAGHAEENDPEMQIIKFTREAAGKKNIIMVNWQGHPTLTGSLTTYDMSADVVGAARMQVEYQTKDHFIYFLGASGNQNVKSYISSENRTLDYQEFGKFLTEYIIAALEDMTPVAVGEVHTYHQDKMCEINRQMEDRLEDAKRIQEYYNDTDRDTGNKLARELGFSSVYHAGGVITRSKITEDELPITLGIYAFGDISFAAAPYEMFAAHGVQIKEGTPYEMTFVATCTNGSEGYLPTEYAFEFGCYESHITRFTGDTGTKCAETFIAMMETMKNTPQEG